MRKKETALEKAKRYESEIANNCYCRNGVMVKMDPERFAYCQSYINEVKFAVNANADVSNPLAKKVYSGRQAAASQLRKDYYQDKNKQETAVVNKVSERQKKRTEKFNNAVNKAVQAELAKMKNK